MTEIQKIPVAEPDIGELEERYVLDAVRSGWVSSAGEYIARFERGFAEYCGAHNAVAVANGTAALHVALVARGIGPGDEVIIPDLTFAATAAAVVHAGATPVLVDVDSESWCIDAELAREAVTDRTKAIIPVHLFGMPAPMTALGEVAKDAGLFVLEDAAEAHGARIGAQRVGSMGEAAAFSFYGNKIITTGEGGCVLTQDAQLAQRVRLLVNHGMSPTHRYFHSEVGFNYRMTNLQAALGCAQLERIDLFLAKKAEVLGWYRDDLASSGWRLNPERLDATPVCWLVVGQSPRPWLPAEQAQAVSRLAEQGIESRPFFVPMHQLPPYSSSRLFKRDRSVAAEVASRGLCLPSSTNLTRDDVRRIANAMRSLS